MKAVVVGCGQMGTAIAYAMCRLNYSVILCDNDADKIAKCTSKLQELQCDVLYTVFDLRDVAETDVVVSAAPYFANPGIAQVCIDKGWNYCDLGGDTETDEIIEGLANARAAKWIPTEHGSTFTSLGLAPGVSNLISEDICSRASLPKSVTIRVGGLPVRPNNTLKYNCTWSLDGLRNEYSGFCEIIRNSFHTQIAALSEVDEIDFPEVGKLESFHTKGGVGSSLQTMLARGVLHCEYKTMRYPGHSALIRFMMNECQMTNDEFDKAIANACPVTKEDQVLIFVEVDQERKYIQILHDDHWTAMQKATAFPIAAVAALMAEKQMPLKQVLDYGDVPVNKMADKLQAIGGLPRMF